MKTIQISAWLLLAVPLVAIAGEKVAKKPDAQKPAVKQDDAQLPSVELPPIDHPALHKPADELPSIETPARAAPKTQSDAAAEKPKVSEPSDADLELDLESAVEKVAGAKYDLKYRFPAKQQQQYRVEHLVTVDTTIEGVRQRAKSRSLSTKVWKFADPRVDGGATFAHLVADVDMWQEVDGRNAVRYDSKSDAKPPVQYEKVSESIGVPLSHITVDTRGLILKRDDKLPINTWGGQLIVPLPPEPVAIGHRWYKPHEVLAKQKDGRVKRVNIRQQYELREVKDGIAKISVAMQVLTPGVQDQPRLMVQFAQRLTHGQIEFDIAAGQVIRQTHELDQTIIGFNGPKSIMTYAGRFTEELIDNDGAEVAAK
jgi:hypothetical protein